MLPPRVPARGHSGRPSPADTKCTARVESRPSVEEINLRPRQWPHDSASETRQPSVSVIEDAPQPSIPPSATPWSDTPPSTTLAEGTSSEQNSSSATQIEGSSWLQSDFRMPSSFGDLKRLSKKIVASTPPLQNLRFIDRTAASYIGIFVVHRSANLDSYHVLKEMCVEESTNCAGALLARVSVLSLIFNFLNPRHSQSDYFIVYFLVPWPFPPYV